MNLLKNFFWKIKRILSTRKKVIATQVDYSSYYLLTPGAGIICANSQLNGGCE